MTSAASEKTIASFRKFADICKNDSPLYAALSLGVVDDPEILALAAGATEGQPPVNLLFAAVHHRLLRGIAHPLARFYPSVGGFDAPSAAWPVFREFCLERSDEIATLVATRRVQTNEVRRCGVLLPALALVHERAGVPLGVIEVGASAGLNLSFDRFRFEYGSATCGAPSTVTIKTDIVASAALPVPQRMPRVAARLGIDIAPVDVTNDDAMHWLEALVWPEQVERLATLRAARAIALREPPRILKGDGIELIRSAVDAMPSGCLPCVFHSHAIYQMDDAWRAAFTARLDEIGRKRDLARVALEWLGDAAGPELHLSSWKRGMRSDEYLADADHHGRWIRARC